MWTWTVKPQQFKNDEKSGTLVSIKSSYPYGATAQPPQPFIEKKKEIKVDNSIKKTIKLELVKFKKTLLPLGMTSICI